MPNKTRDELLDDHTRRHNASIDSTVAQFDRRLQPILARAQARLTEELRGELTVGTGGRILRDAKTQRALRAIRTRFPALMEAEGYGKLLESLSASFGRQIPLFEEVLDILGIPKPTWRVADQRFFDAQARAGVVTLEDLVDGIGGSTYRTALLQIGGLKPARLATLIADETGKTLPQASAIADTATTVYYRTIAARGYDIIEQDGALSYRYYGPKDKLNRPFCRQILEAGRALTRADIAKLRNPNGTDVFIQAGGYRCRHQWIIAVDKPSSHRPEDEAPRAIASTPSAEPAAKRVVAAILASPQEVRKLAAKLPPVSVGTTAAAKSNYQVAEGLLAVSKTGTPAELVHEYFHHIDYGLAEKPHLSVSIDPRNFIGQEIHHQIALLGDLGEPGREQIRPRIDKGNIYLRDLFAALTQNKLGEGHSDDYWREDYGRRFRETFANLGAMYGSAEWSRVKNLIPDLADAFELWLRNVTNQR